MTDRAGVGGTIPLAIFLALADAALALSYHSAAAWAMIALPIAATLASLAAVRPFFHPAIARALTRVSWLLIAAVAFRGNLVGWSIGVVLAALAGVFLMDERAFPVDRAFLPAAFGVFLAAASTPGTGQFTTLAWLATAALALRLITSRPTVVSGFRRVFGLALFAIPCIVVGQGLIMLLPWAQPKVEQATSTMMLSGAGETGLSIGARLGDIEKLARSRRVVLRMWSDQPAYLRAGVYTQFDGRAWQRPPISIPRPVNGAFAAAATSLARFVIEEQAPGVLPAPAGVEAVRAAEGPITLDQYGLVRAPQRPPDEYAIRFAPGGVPLLAGDQDIANDCLQIPVRTDPRVRELAQQLGPSAASAKEKIARTMAHLQTRCRYSLDVGAFRTSDPIAEFLFEKKKGYCEYFASATVLLLRLQDVPARYVNGLSVRDFDRRGDHFVVRASDAHAWAEALVPGEGWVEVDATPPGDYAALHAGQDWWLEDGIELIKSWRAAPLALRQPLLLWLLAAAVVIVAPLLLRRRRRLAARPAPATFGVSPDLAALLIRVETRWKLAGCPRPRHRAPLEHVGTLPIDRVGADLRAVSLEVVQCFYRAAYGGKEIGPAEITGLSRALDKATSPPSM